MGLPLPIFIISSLAWLLGFVLVGVTLCRSRRPMVDDCKRTANGALKRLNYLAEGE